MYYSGMHSNGIWAVELDRSDLTRFLGAPLKLFTVDPSHKWERYGDNNEGTHVSWVEPPWMTKHKGINTRVGIISNTPLPAPNGSRTR